MASLRFIYQHKNYSIKKDTAQFVLFAVLHGLFYGLVFVFSDFFDMPVGSATDAIKVFMQWAIVSFAAFLWVYSLSCFKLTFALFYPIMSVLCAIVVYFRYTAKISLSGIGLELALVNDVRSSMQVVTWQLIVFALLVLAFSIWSVWFRFTRIKLPHSFIHFIVAMGMLVGIFSSYTLARPIWQRPPFNIYAAFEDYQNNKTVIQEQRPTLDTKAFCTSDSLTVVFILGETARAKNLSVNGYKRNTTPLLQAQTNVVSMPHIRSQYGFTHSSVPFILTNSDAQHTERSMQERSFIDLLKTAGYKTAWISNQERVPTFAYFMQEADTLCHVNAGKSVYTFTHWLDEDILPYYYSLLKKASSRSFFLLHTIGSHWWYNAHFTQKFARWQPIAQSRVFSSSSSEQLINSYDNTILYSDYFWSKVIEPLKTRNAVVLYLSDHAENLGEEGLFGHGQESEALHYPACWVWFSNTFAKKYPNKVKALQANKLLQPNTGFFFHTLLDAADVQTKLKNSKRSVFSEHCIDEQKLPHTSTNKQ